MNDLALVKLDNARLALAECKTAMDSKQIADVAEAARVYLERTHASVHSRFHSFRKKQVENRAL